MARNGRKKIIYKGTFISIQTLHTFNEKIFHFIYFITLFDFLTVFFLSQLNAALNEATMRGQKNLYDVLYIAQGYCEAQHECNQYDKKIYFLTFITFLFITYHFFSSSFSFSLDLVLFLKQNLDYSYDLIRFFSSS